MQEPLVSICCITYNHAPFIKQCLEGFLMQKTSFAIEILIHDDCSTDGTTEIIKEYTSKYPHLIFPLYEEENQYQKGKASEIDFYNYKRARGKYIAYCEGDDYWTDPLKLQKQVDFMKANTEYSVCFHEIDVYDNRNNIYLKKDNIKEDFDVSIDFYINGRGNVILPLSMMFRVDSFDFEWQKHYTRYCDSMELTHLLHVGKGRFLAFNGGQYNLHNGGVSTSNTDIRRSWESCEDATEMLNYIKGENAIKTFYIKSFCWRLDICKNNKLYKEYFTAILYSFKAGIKMGMKILKYAFKQIIKNIL